MTKNKMQILEHIDILDKIRIHVMRIPLTGDFEVEIECIDQTKEIVYDDSALRIMNEQVSQKAAQFEARDSRAPMYIEEFVGKLTSELARNGLAELVDIPDAIDPYEDLRKRHGSN